MRKSIPAPEKETGIRDVDTAGPAAEGHRRARRGARGASGEPLPGARARTRPAAGVDGLRVAAARPHGDVAAPPGADDPPHRAAASLAVRVAPAPPHGPRGGRPRDAGRGTRDVA